MTICPRSLLLGLLIILYFQSCVEGNNVNSPDECCFSFYTSPIPLARIVEYKITRQACTNPGVIVTTIKTRVCTDPQLKWVQRMMKIIDRQHVER